MNLDKVGPWSKIKHEIIQEYAAAYTKIMRNMDWCKGFHYVDAFSGAGIALDRETGEPVSGSPLKALELKHKFSEYHFIDLDENKLELLRGIIESRYPGMINRCNFYKGDCNQVLREEICPKFPFESYRRALVILDPYNVGVEWKTLEMIGSQKTMEIFYNFMISDANRNVLWETSSEGKSKAMRQKFDRCMPDNSWEDIMYTQELDLFGDEFDQKIGGNKKFISWYRSKIKKIFNFVPEPALMKNTKGAELYYLFFAAHQAVASKIVNEIFNKYRRLGAG